jgi:predicted GIY-YIG superfamily endonuclease
MFEPKRTLYVLRSVQNPARYYTGVTSDVNVRLVGHNAGKCPHTADGGPWPLMSSSGSLTNAERLHSSAI